MSQNEDFVLTQDEKDIIGEISNISMGAAATALSNIIGQKVIITSPQVEKGSLETIESIEKIPSIGVIISYTEGVVGDNFLIMRSADASKIVNVLMGGEVEQNEDFGEIQISAIAEVMNQMMGGSATALSGFIDRAVNISPPSAFILTEENKKEKLASIYSQLNRVVFVKFQFTVENMFQSEIFMVMTHEFEQELVQAMLAKMGVTDLSQMASDTVQPAPQPEAQVPSAQPAAQPETQVQPAQPRAPQPQPQAAVPQSSSPVTARREAAAAASVRPAVLPQFSPQPVLNADEQNNFELIQDVPLELSVEVGRARKLVREVLDLTTGSIVELDKQAGDPVDVIVNGQLIARGEVVVIDESFGVRITEIIGKKQAHE